MKSTLLTALLVAAFGLSATVAQAGEQLAEKHVKLGMNCQSCHGPDMKNPQTPTMETCTGCHNIAQLVEKTKGIKPTNPHKSPHYGDTLECANCHLMHAESENFCDSCHQFGFKVP